MPFGLRQLTEIFFMSDFEFSISNLNLKLIVYKSEFSFQNLYHADSPAPKKPEIAHPTS